MRRVLAALAVVAVVLGSTACSSAVAGAPAPAEVKRVPRPVSGAYVDVSVQRPDLAAVVRQTGLSQVTLSFALAKDGTCEPAWGGTRPVDALRGDIDAFRAAGGSVSVATGGAVGTYLENACGSAADLAGAYGKLLDATGTNLIDIDVETGVDAAKVVDALSLLQRRRGTDITLTLPVDLAGLTPTGLDLVRRAVAAHLVITVNALDMNFRTGGSWGQAMVDAAQAVLDQLRQVWPNASEAAQNRSLAITVEIGRNEVGPITQPQDAQQVIDFATSRGVGRLGFWSLGRDNGACAGRADAQPNCSGIAQQDLQFARQFAAFTGPPVG
jgi:chitinase